MDKEAVQEYERLLWKEVEAKLAWMQAQAEVDRFVQAHQGEEVSVEVLNLTCFIMTEAHRKAMEMGL